MKNLKLLVVALVAMFGFIACDKHECNDHNHSADLVGTWTCFTADYAEALVIKADGSALSTGVEDGEYWENVAGNIVVKDGKVTMTFEDGDNFEGYLDVVPGIAFTIHDKEGEYYTFNYCANDLADEIVGMWVCNDGPSNKENDMLIQTFDEDGTSSITGYMVVTDDFVTNSEGTTYKVVGNLIFNKYPNHVTSEGFIYWAMRLTYSPKATAFGDVMTFYNYMPTENGVVEEINSWLRIKQHLELANNSYDYSNIYVTNVKAKEAEIEFAGQTFNLATISGDFLDKMMKNILFNVSFPSADKIVYNCYINGENVNMPSPIVVEGNKMTIKKSAYNSVYKDIEVWTFQDQDNTQMHMYMPVKSFENFLANTAVEMKVKKGELDLNNTEAISAIYNGVANAIETINVSFIFKTAK